MDWSPAIISDVARRFGIHVMFCHQAFMKLRRRIACDAKR